MLNGKIRNVKGTIIIYPTVTDMGSLEHLEIFLHLVINYAPWMSSDCLQNIVTAFGKQSKDIQHGMLTYTH